MQNINRDVALPSRGLLSAYHALEPVRPAERFIFGAHVLPVEFAHCVLPNGFARLCAGNA